MADVVFGATVGLWTLGDAPEAMLDRIHGATGINSITIPAVSGAGSCARIDEHGAPHLFATEGGWHYPSKAEAAGGVQARIAKWAGKRDRLGAVIRWAESRGVGVRASIAMRDIDALLEAAPRLRTRNAWGDENPFGGACVLQPELRALLSATIAELTNMGVGSVVLDGWSSGFRAVGSFDNAPAELVNLCFCSACRDAATAAGVDAEAAARSVQQHFKRLGTVAFGPDDRLAEDEVVRGYAVARRTDARQWLAGLATAHATTDFFRIRDWEDESMFVSRADQHGGLSIAGVTTFNDHLLYCEFGDEAEDGDDVRWAQSFFADLTAMMLPVWEPTVDSSDELVHIARVLAEAGTQVFEFCGLGDAPDEALEWMKRAIRIVRRG